MATIEAVKIRVPFIRTFGLNSGNDAPYTPSKLDPDGPIRSKINAELRNSHSLNVLRVENRAVVTLDSIRPHHKAGSFVHWLPEVKDNVMHDWHNPISWEGLIADTEFLAAFQEKVFKEVDEGNPYYAQFGWTPFNNNPSLWYTKQGGMTIKRAHWHSTPPFDQQKIDGYITLDQKLSETDIRFLSLFFDIGSQLAREHISQVKDVSSHIHTWTGMDGLIQRTAYGFYSIQDALSQLYKFHMSLKDDWNMWTEKLYKEYAGDFTVDFDGIEKSLLLFSPIVGGSLFVPTNDEKELIGLDKDHPCRIWVSLLSPIMKPLLVNGVQVFRE